MNYNILNFGAVGDGITNDTAAIQAAIDTCAAAGGGRVTIPGGYTFRCGILHLRSHLELHLEMGAVLKGSDRLADYLLNRGDIAQPEGNGVPSYVNCEYNGAPTHYLLYARDCEDLAITGYGVIDGNETLFHGEVTKWHIEGAFYPRAPLLFTENVRHLTVQQVTLRNSAFWTVHMVGCEDVLIDGIRILNSLRMANCDGIDPDHCRNVRITNCHIECADDCIVFKNTASAMHYGPCENITVSNCTLTSTSAAIKFGSESEALFRNILIENCVISRSNRGISLQLRDKGSIENVIFQNIAIQTRLFRKEVFWGQAEPIAITVLKRKADTDVGTIRNIHFNRIFCDSENGILIHSEEPGRISEIVLDNIRLTLNQTTHHEKGIHDLRPTIGPWFTQSGLHYVQAHNAEDITFRNCRFRPDKTTVPLVTQPFRLMNCQRITGLENEI